MKKIILVIAITLSYFVCFSQEKETYTDIRDGKIYKTIKIGKKLGLPKILHTKQKMEHFGIIMITLITLKSMDIYTIGSRQNELVLKDGTYL